MTNLETAYQVGFESALADHTAPTLTAYKLAVSAKRFGPSAAAATYFVQGFNNGTTIAITNGA